MTGQYNGAVQHISVENLSDLWCSQMFLAGIGASPPPFRVSNISNVQGILRLAKLVQMRFWQIHFDLDQILKLLCRHFQMKNFFLPDHHLIQSLAKKVVTN